MTKDEMRERMIERIKVEQAWVDGEEIETKYLWPIMLDGALGWVSVYSDSAYFKWDQCDYRIKRKPREIWMNINKYGADGEAFPSPVYMSKHEAEKYNSDYPENAVKFVEVMGE